MTAPARYVAVADPSEIVEVVAADGHSTYVRHVSPVRRSVSPDGWDSAMQTVDFRRWFAEQGVGIEREANGRAD